MIHIHSEQVGTGTTYSGTFNFTAPFGGLKSVLEHYFESEKFPFIYPGCNQLKVRRTVGGDIDFLVFPDTKTDVTADVATMLQDAFNTISYLSTVSCVYDLAARKYLVTGFDEAVDLLFEDSASHVRYTFNLKSDLAGVLAFDIPDVYMSPFPVFVQMYISPIVNAPTVTANLSIPALIVPVRDRSVKLALIEFPVSINSLFVELRRHNVPNVPVPFSGRWDLILQ